MNEGVNFEVEIGSSSTNTNLQKTEKLLEDISKQLENILTATSSTSKTLNAMSKTAESSYNNVNKQTKKAVESTKNLDKAIKNVNFQSLVINATRVFNLIKQTIEPFVDYIEDLNLLKVAFGETSDAAKDLIQNIADITGYDVATLTRGLATFRQLTSTLGAANDVADLLATNLEKISLDISSLYNVNLDRASYALQGALTGQPRSIKTITGADITQDTLQAELARLGIDRKISSLNQAEKAIISYLSIERQLINSNGDLARTLDQPANMLRIFQEQIKRAARNIGNLFIPALKAILPVATAILMVFSTIIEIITSFLGIDTTSFWKEMETGIGDITAGLDTVSQTAKETQKNLRGFDKLNVIRTPSSNDSSSGIGGLGIDSRLLAALDEYNLGLDEIQTKAAKIRDTIMEWLGFTKDVNGEWKFTNITLGTIIGSLLAIATGYAGIKKVFDAVKGISSIFGTFKSENKLTKSVETIASVNPSKISLISTAIGGVAKAVGAAFLTYEGLKIGTAGLIKLLVGDLDDTSAKLKNVSDETKRFLQPVQDAYNNVSKTIGSVDVTKIGVDAEEKQKIVDSIDDLTSVLNSKIDEYVDKAKQSALQLYKEGFISKKQYDQKIKELENYQNTQKNKYKSQNSDLIELQKQLYNDEGELQTEKYIEFTKMLDEYNSDSLKSLTLNAADRLIIEKDTQNMSRREQIKYYSDLLQNYAKDRDDAIAAAKQKRDETIRNIQQTYDESDPLYQKLIDRAMKMYDEEVEKAETSYSDIYNALANNITGMSDFIDKDDGHLFSTWEYVCNKFKTDWQSTWKTVGDFFNNIWNGIKKKLSDPIEVEIKTHTDTSGLDKIPSPTSRSNVTSGGGFKAEGGFVNTGEMFIAREAGPELVGRIGSRTAVANNDQIVKGIAAGVTSAIKSTGGFGNNRPIIIKAEGDADGLLNFITFKQKEEDMQFGN